MKKMTPEDIERCTERNIESFFKEMGEPFVTEPVSQEILEKFKGKLPERLLELWRIHGFCGFRDGLFWLTNPDDYEPALEAWFGDTPAVEKDSQYVIARTAFGKLFLWGTHTGARYQLKNPGFGWLYDNEDLWDERTIREGKSDWVFSIFLFLRRDPQRCDIEDEYDKPLFERAVRKLGPLAANEMLAFTPAPGLGGEFLLSKLSKVDIHIHLDLLAQMLEHHMFNKRSLSKAAFGPTAEWPKGLE